MTEDKFELYERISKENMEFKKLFDEHIRFEQDLEALNIFHPKLKQKSKRLSEENYLVKIEWSRLLLLIIKDITL